jgi:hypothetical protein
MDHYCPWTNNAIGATNQKMFILFVIYTDVAAMYYYYLLGIIMVSCVDGSLEGARGVSYILLTPTHAYLSLFCFVLSTGILYGRQLYHL